MSSLDTSPCPCGRTSFRLTGITGRVGDAVKVRGLFVVGKQVEALFAGYKEVARVQVTVDRLGQRDHMALKIELKDKDTETSALLGDIMQHFQSQCLLRPDKIEFVPVGTIAEGSKTICDVRKWG
jgi:phenylacetate-CoA ligase